MHILITGGTGLIGSALVKRWQNHYKLTILSRSPKSVTTRFGEGVTAVDSLEDVDFNAVSAVINLAGEPIVGKRWSTQQKHTLCNSRWQCTTALANAINRASTPPQVLISGSAIGFYGAQQAQLISEDFSHVHDDFPHQLCKQWEAVAQEAASPQTRVCLLRTGVVLAKNGGALKKMLPPFQLGLGGKIGSGQQYMSWVHIDDIVQIIEFLLLHPTLQGVFNATAPTPVTNTQFSLTLAKVLHRPALLPVPAFILNLLLGEMATLLLDGQRVIPANLTKAGYQFQYTELEPALNNLLSRRSAL